MIVVGKPGSLGLKGQALTRASEFDMRSVEVQQTSQHCQSLGQDPAVQSLGHEVLIQSIQLETEEVDESHPAFLTLEKNVKRLVLVESNHKIF